MHLSYDEDYYYVVAFFLSFEFFHPAAFTLVLFMLLSYYNILYSGALRTNRIGNNKIDQDMRWRLLSNRNSLDDIVGQNKSLTFL